eukprot:CAMPEP_0184553652 /NCGR_PEP_ID=MMETSP0199_2-20130426/32774_1 /TAXON_ID=1112570 /ORGANISM="Thraustochytrium sp., Strain LLF1b" /LENGTH=48 /DNA_ID= /DNA_START= /DNA_END= /DNA_ORIENTATION=
MPPCWRHAFPAPSLAQPLLSRGRAFRAGWWHISRHGLVTLTTTAHGSQ